MCSLDGSSATFDSVGTQLSKYCFWSQPRLGCRHQEFLGVDAVRMTGNEAVSDTIIVSVQNYISCIDDVGPQMQRTKYSNELAFENDCLALAHIDLLQQVRTQLLGDNRCFFPRESTMTAPKLPSKQPEDRF